MIKKTARKSQPKSCKADKEATNVEGGKVVRPSDSLRTVPQEQLPERSKVRAKGGREEGGSLNRG
eukprot:176411-Hanusia_phi.AAC.1